MLKIFVITLLIFGAAIVIFLSKIILIKKSIVYKHKVEEKKLTSFDYFTDYDGNWLLKKIDFEKLYAMTQDSSLFESKKEIQIYERLSIFFFAIILVFAIFIKLKGFL